MVWDEFSATVARERIAALRRQADQGGWPGPGRRQPRSRAKEG